MAHIPSFGTLLRGYRRERGLTQEALAERAGLSVRALSDLEREVKRRPRKDTVALLAEALALTGPDRAAFEAAARALLTPATAWRPAGLSPPPGGALPPLTGRTHELALLERHLARSPTPLAPTGPPVLLLAGEPGIGKSRLLREAVGHATAGGWCVVEGGCQRRGSGVPFGEPYAPLLGALERHIERQRPAQRRAALAGCAWLVRLLPELVAMGLEPLPPWTLPPEQERRLMFKAVARFLTNVAGPAGTLLMLDDLQWAGADALDLLATLVRSAEAPLRVVGAYRDTDVRPQDPLASALADLAHAGLVAQRTLSPLTPEEAGDLLAGLLEGVVWADAALRERLLARSGGVPFFLVSCAQGLRVRGVAEGGEGGADVPWDLTQGLRQRVAALSAVAQEVLGVAAVVGRVAPRALLTAVAAWPEKEVLTALAAACQAGLLVEDGEDAYRFAHDVVREVVEADLGAGRRTLLHRRVGEALERGRGEPPVELLAYHYAHSAEQDRAARYGEQAGDRAVARYAHTAAESHYRGAAERLERLGQGLDRARVQAKLGAVLAFQAQYEAALAVLDEAAATYRRSGDLESLARVMAQMGRIHTDRGTAAEGLHRLQALLEPMEGAGPSPGLAALYATMAHMYLTTGHFSEQLTAAERGAHLARMVRDDRILAHAEFGRAIGLALLGRVEEGLQASEEAIRLADVVGDLSTLVTACGFVATALLFRGELEQSRSYNGRQLEAAERLGNPAHVAYGWGWRGWIAFHGGDWIQARMDLERAVATAREIGTFWRLTYGLIVLGQLYGAVAEQAAAVHHVEQGLAAAERGGDLQAVRIAQSVLAEWDLQSGHASAARARLAPLLDRPGLQEWSVTVFVLSPLARAYLEMGAVAQAEALIAQAEVRLRTGKHRLALVDALRVQALVEISQQREPAAERILEDALALARSIPYPYGEARLLDVCGHMYAQAGESARARERLEAALTIFQRLGAGPDAGRAKRSLACLPP